MADDLALFERLHLSEEARHRIHGVDASERHRAVAHHTADEATDPHHAFLLGAQVILFGFTDDGGSHAVGPAVLDEVLDADKHDLLSQLMERIEMLTKPVGQRQEFFSGV